MLVRLYGAKRYLQSATCGHTCSPPLLSFDVDLRMVLSKGLERANMALFFGLELISSAIPVEVAKTRLNDYRCHQSIGLN